MKKLFFILLSTILTFQILYAQKKMTSFNPSKHGFNFENAFKVSFGDPGSIKADWGGLCGGMTFAAADYFYKSKKIPSQKYTPANGTDLYQYLFDRQQDALWKASLDKTAENWFNPLGSRNEEFWGWAVDERLKQIRRFINLNKPIPILLFNGKSNDVAKNHWVLAIGYDLAGYNFKKKNDPAVEDVKIFVYDPNQPNKMCVLSPRKGGDWLLDYHLWDAKTNKYKRSLDRYKRKWRHYYVYTDFSSKNPPTIKDEPVSNSDDVYKLVVKFKTGGDDLRGGKDNVNVVVNYKNGKSETFRNVNSCKRWPDNSTNNVELRLKNKVKYNEIKSLKISTTFGGGMGGDNWNLNYLTVKAYLKNGKDVNLKSVSGNPWKRFTGDKKHKTLYIL